MRLVQLPHHVDSTIVMFVNGAGGTFLSNCFNLADDLVAYHEFQSDVVTAIEKPVSAFGAHENAPGFLNMRLIQMHWYLGDQETAEGVVFGLDEAILRSLAFEVFHADPERLRHGPVWSGRTLYHAAHPNPVATPTLPSVERLTAVAKAHGVALRYVVALLDDEDLPWAIRRENAVKQFDKPTPWFTNSQASLKEMLAAPNAVPLHLSRFMRGDVDHLVNQVYGLVHKGRNHALIRKRASEFYEKKCKPYFERGRY